MMNDALLFTGLIVIAGTSLLTYSRLGMFYFAKGSDATLLVARPSPWILAAITAGLSLFITFLIWRSRMGFVELIFLLFLLSLWAIGGRVVGVFPDGRIVAGWFFLSTKVVDFRRYEEDPDLYVSHTKILVASRWVMEIRSGRQRATIFVGPMLQNPLLELLEERGFNVVRTTVDGAPL